MLAPSELKRVHPLGKSPVIEDDGKKFAETGLIVEYLVESYGPDFAPPRLVRPLLALQILAALCGGLADAAAPAQARRRQAWVCWGCRQENSSTPNSNFILIISKASWPKPRWFLGEGFSAADIMMSFPLEAASARAGLDETRPKLFEFSASASTRGRLTSVRWKKAALTDTRSPKAHPLRALGASCAAAAYHT